MKLNVEGFIEDIQIVYLKCQSPLVKVSLRNIKFEKEFFSFVSSYEDFKELLGIGFNDYGFVLGSLVRIELSYVPNKEFKIKNIKILGGHLKWKWIWKVQL